MLDTTQLEPEFDYRLVLKKEFENRLRANRRYSLRAFSRDLELDQAHLSSIIRGHKKLSLEKALVVSRKLYKNPHKIQAFYNMVELSYYQDKIISASLKEKIRSLILEKDKTDQNIQEEEFHLISDWYHLPILELTQKNSWISSDAVADYFKLGKDIVKIATARLVRLGFMRKEGDAYQKIRSVAITTTLPSFAMRSFHSQMIKKALEALVKIPVTRRYNSSLTLRIPASQIAEYKKAVDEFEDKILQLSSAFPNEDKEVYQLNTQLFPLKESTHE